jgi:hypothetical protein
MASSGLLHRLFRRDAASRRARRVAELQKDPAIKAAVREGLESERLGKGVRFEDLKRTDA